LGEAKEGLGTFFSVNHDPNPAHDSQPVARVHSIFFGHLLYLKPMIDKQPPNAHHQSALGDIARDHFSKEGFYYLNLWPVSGLFLVAVSPHLANQIHANSIMSMER
jgi:hypothetical protein